MWTSSHRWNVVFIGYTYTDFLITWQNTKYESVDIHFFLNLIVRNNMVIQLSQSCCSYSTASQHIIMLLLAFVSWMKKDNIPFNFFTFNPCILKLQSFKTFYNIFFWHFWTTSPLAPLEKWHFQNICESSIVLCLKGTKLKLHLYIYF